MPGIRVNQGGTVKQVKGLHVNDGGTVKAVVEAYVNDGGTVKKFWPDVGPPSAITDLRVTAQTSNSISLAWTAAVANGSPVTGYEISYGTAASGTFGTIKNVGAAAVSDTITGLTSETEYRFRIRANSALGFAPYSNIVTGTTTGLTVPFAPTLNIGGRGTSNVNLSISAGGGGTPDFYDVQYRAFPYTGTWLDGGSFAYTGPTTNASVGGLLSAQGYEFRALARNAVGSSAYSSSVREQTTGTIASGFLTCAEDSEDVGTFRDVGYGLNSVSSGGGGAAFGTQSPTSVAGFVVEKQVRSGQQVWSIRLRGTTVPQNTFTRLSFKYFSPWTGLSSAATYIPNQGTDLQINSWSWENIPPEFISAITSGAFVNFDIA